MAAGTMVELSAATDDIDTSDNLNMFTGYQKAFVVNGSNLKVVDFINTKLTSDVELSNVPTKGDILKQDQTGGDIAYMVVDFISKWDSSSHYIYGYAYYAGSATAFTTSHNVVNQTESDETVITSANLSSVDEASDTPHWYDWITYNGDTDTYGELPNRAYLGCLYRGRPVLSGDPEHPHQWYMARQSDPWDFAYTANDAQSPVAGGNSDAGEIGDIIRAIIPYKDDYLVFGCSTSVWYMAGDPAAGGSINELDLTVGMFGANSWCFDGKGSLYFWGTNGIYTTQVPGNPECISEVALPNLVNDENADPSSYRITMEYDRLRSGILICITKLLDGSNSNWWLDLRSNGLFPETYPDVCGAYSLFYYGANDNDYRGLLVGCMDGYIREFNSSLKSDNISGDNAGSGTSIINSHITVGPVQLSKDPGRQGKLSSMNIIPVGGRPSGSESDSDDITFRVATGESSDSVLEKFSNTDYRISGTVHAPGRLRGNKRIQKVRGTYAGIKLENPSLDESWSFEKLIGNIKQSGRRK